MEDYQSLYDRVNIQEREMVEQIPILEQCLTTMGGQILEVQQDSVRVGTFVNDVTQMTVVQFQRMGEKMRRISTALDDINGAKTMLDASIAANQPTTVDLTVTCPHHRDQRIAFQVPKYIYISPDTRVPTEFFGCPLKLSHTCRNQAVTGDWKKHIKATCLPKMMRCRRSNNPDEECGPEPE